MKLFETTQLAGLELSNRVVMAPMTRSRAVVANAPGDLEATYYGQRASAGLIITEGTAPSPNGLGYPRIPGLFSPAQVAGWRKVTDSVHDKGGRIFVQLMHVGRVAHQANLPEGGEVIAPSSVELPGEMYTDSLGMQPHTAAREMIEADIHQTQQEYVEAARNAIEAGFDGVELHAANGYLMEQFIHPHTNRRNDRYGGSLENRSRFLLETAQLMADAIGKNRVGVRLSPYGTFNDMPHYDEIDATYTYLARHLSAIGVAYLHLCDASGMGGSAIPRSTIEAIRGEYNGVLILCGDYDKARAEEALASGLADLIAFGRPFISNPDLVARYHDDLILAEPDMETLYTPGEKGYIDYPFASAA